MRGPGSFAACAGAAAIAALTLVWSGTAAERGPGEPDVLSRADVDAVLSAAAAQLDDDTMAVAVVDRGGAILGVYVRPGTDALSPDQAVTVARAAAFFTNDQALLFSRTVRSISGIHFPAGIPNTPNAALYGIEITNRGCEVTVPPGSPYESLEPPRSIAGTFGRKPGAQRPRLLPCQAGDTRGCARGGPILDLDGIPLRSVGITTGKANLLDRDPAGDVEAGVNPGGAPLVRNGQVIGGVGVTGVSTDRAAPRRCGGSGGERRRDHSAAHATHTRRCIHRRHRPALLFGLHDDRVCVQPRRQLAPAGLLARQLRSGLPATRHRAAQRPASTARLSGATTRQRRRWWPQRPGGGADHRARDRDCERHPCGDPIAARRALAHGPGGGRQQRRDLGAVPHARRHRVFHRCRPGQVAQRLLLQLARRLRGAAVRGRV